MNSLHESQSNLMCRYLGVESVLQQGRQGLGGPVLRRHSLGLHAPLLSCIRVVLRWVVTRWVCTSW